MELYCVLKFKLYVLIKVFIYQLMQKTVALKEC